ncbi:MAG: FAD-binding oxidoreductase [Rhodothalassiaceae bacterium]
MSLPAHILDAFRKVVGPGGWVDDPQALAPHVADWRGRIRGRTPLLLRPKDAEEVAQVVRLANQHRVPLVPQGGNTGLVFGGVPDDSGREIVVSLTRMNRIRAVDAANSSLIAEAGVTLRAVQEAAAGADRLFPLSFGSEGTATVGGFVSTNAGGVHVLKYGTTRALVLGLEAVLPTGDIWHGLGALVKDNTGYDLKSLLVGAEGTLGIVTAAALKLFPPLRAHASAFVALPSPAAAVDLLARLRAASDDRVIAFELISHFALGLAVENIPDCRAPLAPEQPWYVLVALASTDATAPLGEILEGGLAAAMEAGLVADAAIAGSLAQADDFWRLRHGLSEAQRPAGVALKHDVSVPPARIPELIAHGSEAVARLVPGIRPCIFGHVGDGNLHYDLIQPADMARDAYLARGAEVTHALHDVVAALGGSVSAEHGIGRMKVAELLRLKDPAALAAMRAVKAALDPRHILNPSRILPVPRSTDGSP